MAQFDLDALARVKAIHEADKAADAAQIAMIKSAASSDAKWKMAKRKWRIADRKACDLFWKLIDWMLGEGITIHPSQQDQAEQILDEIYQLRHAAIERAWASIQGE